MSLVLAACGTSSHRQANPTPARERSAPPGWATVDDRLGRRLRTDHLAGAVLVVRHGGLELRRRTYGRYNEHTVLPMASASKWLTAATVMTLVDQGRLTLDAPVSTYAPSLQGAVGRVTMRQLLAHTHGLSDAPACVLDPAQEPDLCDDEISALAPVSAPGSQFHYGPTGPTLAARVVELLAGQPFEEAFQARIARPLAMAHTSFLGPAGPGAGPARTVPDPAAGVVSSAADYLYFLEMLASNGSAVGSVGVRVVLSPMSVSALLTVATAHAHFKDDQVAADLPSIGYGLGAWVEQVGPDGLATFIDGSGAYGTYPWIDRRRGVYGILVVYDPVDPGATGAVARSRADVVAVGQALDRVGPHA